MAVFVVIEAVVEVVKAIVEAVEVVCGQTLSAKRVTLSRPTQVSVTPSPLRPPLLYRSAKINIKYNKKSYDSHFIINYCTFSQF